MKITCSKRDEVLRRKAEYEDAQAKYNTARNEAEQLAREARYAVTDPIEEKIKRDLAIFTALRFDVTVREDHHWKGSSKYNKSQEEMWDDKPVEDYLTSLEVRIKCNEDRHGDNDALRWEYTAKLDDDGNVANESGSWSGLQATTPEQLTSLRQTVSALEYINSIDWPSLIEVRMPNTRKYYKDLPKNPGYMDFTSELNAAELEDAVGADYWIKCQNWDNSPYSGSYIWVKILNDSGSQWRLSIIPGYTVDNYINRYSYRDSRPDWYESLSKTFENGDPGTNIRARKTTVYPARDANGELITFSPEDY